MVKKNVCIFISGYGSNLKSLILYSRNYNFPINIKLVVSNNLKAKGLSLARKNSIPYLVIDTKKRNYEKTILKKLKKNKISLICLAGYMKILSKQFILEFGKKIINIHPSLLPKFKGLNTYEKALENKEIKTGCTVHYVDEKLDNGKKIKQKFFFIDKNDDIEILKRKTKTLERKAFPEAIVEIFRYN